MKEKIYNVLLGLTLLGLSIILGGEIFNIWHINVFFKGWYSILIIIPALAGVILKSNKLTYLYTFSIGLVLLLFRQGMLSLNKSLLILVGLLVLIVSLYILKLAIFKEKKISEDSYLYTAILGGIDYVFGSNNFLGCRVISFCGTALLDFRNMKVKGNKDINITCILGSVDIILPKDVEVVLVASSILGGTDLKKVKPVKETGKITIRVKNILGNVDIR